MSTGSFTIRLLMVVGDSIRSTRSVVFKLFWVAPHLEVFDLTEADLELHQTNSSAFTLLVKKLSLKHCPLNKPCKTEKFGSHFNVNQYSA